MSNRTITVEVPEEVIDLVGSPDVAAAKMKESLVMDLLRRAEISQGKAARLLGISRWDLLDLMVPYQIPSGPETVEELREEIEAVQRYLEQSRSHAGS